MLETKTSELGKGEPKKRFSFLNILAVTTFGLGTVLVLYIFYLMWWPNTPLVIKNVHIVTPIVKSGGTVIYSIDSCKYTQDTPQVYKKIVSSNVSESIPAAA